jgi:hypothetical protein
MDAFRYIFELISELFVNYEGMFAVAVERRTAAAFVIY